MKKWMEFIYIFEVLDVEDVYILLGSKMALIIFTEPNIRHKNMILK